MSIDNFLNQLNGITKQFPFIRQIEEIDRTDHAIKVRLIVNSITFVQAYMNSKTKTAGFALVLGSERIYGRDSQAGKWHLHPFADPQTHDRSKEGKKKIDLTYFLTEVQQILKDKELL